MGQSQKGIQEWCQQDDGIGVSSTQPPPRNISLNNYPHTKIPSQELRIPGEGLQHLGETNKRHTGEHRKDGFQLPVIPPPNLGSLGQKDITPKGTG